MKEGRENFLSIVAEDPVEEKNEISQQVLEEISNLPEEPSGEGPLLNEEEEKLFHQYLPYAKSLARLYPRVDKSELSSLAYHALLKALKGWNLKGKYWDPSKNIKLETLISSIFKHDVMTYLSNTSKKLKREPGLGEVIPYYGEDEGDSDESLTETVHFLETIEDLGDVKHEDVATWNRMVEKIESVLSPSDLEIFELLMDGHTLKSITEIINEKYGLNYAVPRTIFVVHRRIIPQLKAALGPYLDLSFKETQKNKKSEPSEDADSAENSEEAEKPE